VIWKGYLEDKELIPLMQESSALIQPSLSEGFGLTGIEAMACGVPVLASDIPIFREVYQDGAWYFEPQQASTLVKKLQQLEPKTVQQKIETGLKLVAKYNWKTMAQQTLKTFLEVLPKYDQA
jgi:glycosyltransferase involved in cell wall biosynthesis